MRLSLTSKLSDYVAVDFPRLTNNCETPAVKRLTNSTRCYHLSFIPNPAPTQPLRAEPSPPT